MKPWSGNVWFVTVIRKLSVDQFYMAWKIGIYWISWKNSAPAYVVKTPKITDCLNGENRSVLLFHLGLYLSSCLILARTCSLPSNIKERKFLVQISNQYPYFSQRYLKCHFTPQNSVTLAFYRYRLVKAKDSLVYLQTLHLRWSSAKNYFHCQ